MAAAFFVAAFLGAAFLVAAFFGAAFLAVVFSRNLLRGFYLGSGRRSCACLLRGSLLGCRLFSWFFRRASRRDGSGLLGACFFSCHNLTPDNRRLGLRTCRLKQLEDSANLRTRQIPGKSASNEKISVNLGSVRGLSTDQLSTGSNTLNPKIGVAIPIVIVR